MSKKENCYGENRFFVCYLIGGGVGVVNLVVCSILQLSDSVLEVTNYIQIFFISIVVDICRVKLNKHSLYLEEYYGFKCSNFYYFGAIMLWPLAVVFGVRYKVDDSFFFVLFRALIVFLTGYICVLLYFQILLLLKKILEKIRRV
jgi:hypothetical protein